MSSRINIEPCKFENVRTGIVTQGVRVYDDHGQTYDNTWDSIPDDDIDVLAKVMESDDPVTVAIIDHLNEHRGTVHIGDEAYQERDYGHLFG